MAGAQEKEDTVADVKKMLGIALCAAALAGCTQAPAPSIPPSAVLIDDSFNDNTQGWGEAKDEIRVGNGVLEMNLSAGEFQLNSPYALNGQVGKMGFVSIKTTAALGGTAGEIGLGCYSDDSSQSSYVGAIRSTGLVEILRFEQGEPASLATEQLSALDTSRQHNLEMTCEYGTPLTIALSVDGRQVAVAIDQEPLNGGLVGVFAQAGPDGPCRIRFHDFVAYRTQV